MALPIFTERLVLRPYEAGDLEQLERVEARADAPHAHDRQVDGAQLPGLEPGPHGVLVDADARTVESSEFGR